jgi:tRNA(adenine34) deaminase
MFTHYEEWMRIAIDAAVKAAEIGEVPVGAVVVDENGDLIAVSSNLTISNSDPTAHAEILALREAAAKVGNYRLTGTTVFSTVEPCAMCAGALVNARVARLVFGAHDERFGAVETHFGIGTSEKLNHRLEIVSSVLAEDCRELMQQFFRARRR